MRKILSFVYGIFAYVMFLSVSTYGIGFVGNLVVKKSIDTEDLESFPTALAVDILLIALFGIQHSVMARKGFKKNLRKLLPQHLERSTFVISTSVVLMVLFHNWRSMPATIWDVSDPIASGFLWGMFAMGWLLLFASTFLIDHFDLFGLKQVYCYLRQIEYHEPRFVTPALYKYVRHPSYVGVLIAFWATPHMTIGHLVFAVAMTLYIRVGIAFEENGLIAEFGDVYRKYQREVPMLIPYLRKR